MQEYSFSMQEYSFLISSDELPLTDILFHSFGLEKQLKSSFVVIFIGLQPEISVIFFLNNGKNRTHKIPYKNKWILCSFECSNETKLVLWS